MPPLENNNPSKVVTPEGFSNYTGRSGLTGEDKNYFETLLQNAMGALPKSRSQHQGGSPVMANYSGSMIGNVPLMAARGVDFGGMINTVDDLFRQQQINKARMLSQDEAKVTQLAVGAFNEPYNNLFKGVVDTGYSKYLNAYKDPAVAKSAWLNSSEYKLTVANMDNFAKDFNSSVELIRDLQKSINNGEYVPQEIQDKMVGILSTGDLINTRYAQKDKNGNFVSMNLEQFNQDVQGLQAFPAIDKVATAMTENLDNTVKEMKMAFDNGKQFAFNTETWKNALSDEQINGMVDIAMGSKYKGIIGGRDDAETRRLLKGMISTKIKTLHETAIELKDNADKDKGVKRDQIGVTRNVTGNLQMTNYTDGATTTVGANNIWTMDNTKKYDMTSPLSPQWFFSETTRERTKVVPGENQFVLQEVFSAPLDANNSYAVGVIAPDGTGVVGTQRLARGVIKGKNAGSYSETNYSDATPEEKNRFKGLKTQSESTNTPMVGVWVDVYNKNTDKFDRVWRDGDVSFTVPASNLRGQISEQTLGWEQENPDKANELYKLNIGGTRNAPNKKLTPKEQAKIDADKLTTFPKEPEKIVTKVDLGF
jgi:hypothetical protein